MSLVLPPAECGWCEELIEEDAGVVDEDQVFWLGLANAARFCNTECHNNASEAWHMRQQENFYGA